MNKSARGYTLIETLIASSLLFMFVAGIFIILQSLLQTVGESRVRLVAASLAQDRLELARNLPYIDVGVGGGIPSGNLLQNEIIDVNGQDFEISTSVLYIDDSFDDIAPIDLVPIDYKRVRVEIDWEGAFTPKNPLVFMTDIAPIGIESLSNAGTLSIQVFDAQVLPVPNASVSIYSDTVFPIVDLEVVSDNDGKIMIPGAPICFECYEISATKAGYSTDRTYGSLEVANPSKPHASVQEGGLTPLSFEIDRLSTLNVTASRSRSAGYEVFPGVNFILTGSKTIGTDTLDNPVPKFENNYVTGSFGQVSILNLEWDTYALSLPAVSSIDLAGITPLSPFGLLADTSKGVSIVAEANSAHSLLIAVTDSSSNLLPEAEITLYEGSVPVATKSAGLNGFGDKGQAFFGDLSSRLYNLLVTLDGYENATGSVSINDDVGELIILTEN